MIGYAKEIKKFDLLLERARERVVKSDGFERDIWKQKRDSYDKKLVMLKGAYDKFGRLK